jgi:hypothetical protein
MKDCVIITSVVQTTDKPLNYSKTRSVYSHQQRFEQTLETIESVRTCLPHAHILLVECSPPSEWMDALREKTDQFLNLEFHELVNHHPEKGLGEKTLMLHGLSNLQEEYSSVYKITGRYVLQESLFHRSEWEETTGMTFCRTDNYGVKDGIHTFFYRIPGPKLPVFRDALESYNGVGACIENHLVSRLREHITHVEKIGILVRWACYEHAPIL